MSLLRKSENDELRELISEFDEFAFIVTRKIVAALKQSDLDLTSDQHLIMRYIDKKGPCTSSQLAEVFYVNKSAVTAIINRLTAKGYMERMQDEHDRRVYHLQLTTRGKKVLHKGEEHIQKVVGTYLSCLNDEEVTTFLRTFKKLAYSVREHKGEVL